MSKINSIFHKANRFAKLSGVLQYPVNMKKNIITFINNSFKVYLQSGQDIFNTRILIDLSGLNFNMVTYQKILKEYSQPSVPEYIPDPTDEDGVREIVNPEFNHYIPVWNKSINLSVEFKSLSLLFIDNQIVEQKSQLSELGTFGNNKIIIRIPLLNRNTSYDTDEVESTVEHELIHLMQSIIKESTSPQHNNYNEKQGIPSEWVPKNEQWINDKDYFISGIEFFPLLNDTINSILLNPSLSREDLKDLILSNKFLNELKASPNMYRRAIKEIYKKVSQKYWTFVNI